LKGAGGLDRRAADHGCVSVNIGDMLEIFNNGLLRRHLAPRRKVKGSAIVSASFLGD